jgi:hypothetical protein
MQERYHFKSTIVLLFSQRTVNHSNENSEFTQHGASKETTIAFGNFSTIQRIKTNQEKLWIRNTDF